MPIMPTVDSSGPVLRLGGRSLAVNRALIMGVVNASPESFSDARQFINTQSQLQRCAELIESGADILDIGGQSAITNQPEIDAETERARVVPLVEWVVRSHPDTLISVDTYKPSVVDACLAAGAHIINDVSGLEDPAVIQSCVRHQAALVIMHTRARPKVRLQQRDLYDDVAVDVLTFLREQMRSAIGYGLSPESIILDPGPDFTKTPHQTVQMLRAIPQVRDLGRPILLALSRKDFLGAITGKGPRGRDVATHAAFAYFAASPGNIMRVHDVAAIRDVVSTIEVLAGINEIDPDFVLPDAIRYEPERSNS